MDMGAHGSGDERPGTSSSDAPDREACQILRNGRNSPAAGSLQASSTSGSVQTALSGMRDSYADLDSTAGSIDAKVSRTLTSGFDLAGRSDLGTVAIVVAGTEPVGSQSSTSAHYRSANYDSSSPRVRIVAQTSVGSVLIHE